MPADAPPAEAAPEPANAPTANGPPGDTGEDAVMNDAPAAHDAKEDVVMTDVPVGSMPVAETKNGNDLSAAVEATAEQNNERIISPEVQTEEPKTVAHVPETLESARKPEADATKAKTSDMKGVADTPKEEANPDVLATKEGSALAAETPANASDARKEAEQEMVSAELEPEKEGVVRKNSPAPPLPSAAVTGANPSVVEAPSTAEKESAAGQTAENDTLTLDPSKSVEKAPSVQASAEGAPAPEAIPAVAEDKAVADSTVPSAEPAPVGAGATSKPEGHAPVVTPTAEEKPASAENVTSVENHSPTKPIAEEEASPPAKPASEEVPAPEGNTAQAAKLTATEKAAAGTKSAPIDTSLSAEQPARIEQTLIAENLPAAAHKSTKPTEQPVVHAEKPAVATASPASSAEKPVVQEKKPIETTEKAAVLAETPTALTETATVPNEQSVTAKEKPVVASSAQNPSSTQKSLRPDQNLTKQSEAPKPQSATPMTVEAPSATAPTVTPASTAVSQPQKAPQPTPAASAAAAVPIRTKSVASAAPVPARTASAPKQAVSAAPVPGMIRIPMSGITTPKAGATTRPSTGGPPPPKRARVSGTLDAGGSAGGHRGNGADLSAATLQRYRECAAEAGVRLIAKASAGIQVSGDARRHFLEDHSRYMREIGAEFKLRTIGGSKLDLFTLYVSVLERGGVQAVISSRTFRLVAKALDLPRSCTSAAYILRSDYEKMLYYYEQKHVWGRDPVQAPPLTVVDRNSRPSAVQPSPQLLRNTPRSAARMTPRAASNAANTAASTPASARPKRQAALAASSAVAAAAAAQQDDYGSPSSTPRRTRTVGIDEMSLTPTEEAIVEEEVNANAPHTVYVPGAQGERERVISALWSTVHDDVAFALGTLNALSFDPRNTFQARQFTGLLDALYEIMHRHLEDVLCSRSFSLPAGAEQEDPAAPRVAPMSAVDVADAGHVGGAPGIGVSGEAQHDGVLRSSSLQQYGNLFNVVDSVAVDREQCAVVAVNILRNMSFSDRNAIFLSESQPILELSAEMILTVKVPANLRDGLMDMWINVSPYLNVSKGYPGHVVLTTCIKLLDPFLEGADYSRFTNCGEVLARLAASPERNEDAFVGEFNELLPRLVDMLGGKDRRYINAGLAALCNCSAFDWPARSRIARVPRAMPRLVNMLADPELAPRAALTLLNLAEAPSNRSVLLAYEKQLVEQAIKISPAADTVASVLFDLSND